ALAGVTPMTSSLTSRAARFRALNEAGRLLLPNAWDAAALAWPGNCREEDLSRSRSRKRRMACCPGPRGAARTLAIHRSTLAVPDEEAGIEPLDVLDRF